MRKLTILSGQSATEGLLMGLPGHRLCAVYPPDTVDGANLLIETERGNESGDWVPLDDDEGNPVSVPMTGGRAIGFSKFSTCIAACERIRFVSDAAETSDREFLVSTK